MFVWVYIIFVLAEYYGSGVESFSFVAGRGISITRIHLKRSRMRHLYANTNQFREVKARQEKESCLPNVFQSISSWGGLEAKGAILTTLLCATISLSPSLGNAIEPVSVLDTASRKTTALSAIPLPCKGEAVTSSLTLSSSTLAPMQDVTSRTSTSPSIANRGILRLASIMDLAGVLGPEDVPEILEVMEKAQQKTQSEIQILIVDQVENGFTPKSMATELFNQWKLGTAKKNNGVLILVVLDERRTEIEVGKALDSAMNAQWCQRILKQNASPAFRQKQYGKGILTTVQEVSQKLEEVDHGLSTSPRMGSDLLPVEVRVLGIFIIAFSPMLSAYMDRYQIRVNCPSCNAGKDTWEYSEEGWVTTLEATDNKAGVSELKGTCANCGYVYSKTRSIRRYDGSTTDEDGNLNYYYYNDRSSDSGGSSDGGGGGDSW